MADFQEMQLTRLEDVVWDSVAKIQVKRYEVGRRMKLDGLGPLKSLPLLGTVKRWAVELIHKDDTWDRTHFLDGPAAAHRIGVEMAMAHGLEFKVVV